MFKRLVKIGLVVAIVLGFSGCFGGDPIEDLKKSDMQFIKNAKYGDITDKIDGQWKNENGVVSFEGNRENIKVKNNVISLFHKFKVNSEKKLIDYELGLSVESANDVYDVTYFVKCENNKCKVTKQRSGNYNNEDYNINLDLAETVESLDKAFLEIKTMVPPLSK